MDKVGRYVFDIEADGLYQNATKVHCIRAYDLETGTMHRFDEFNEPIFRGIKLLNEAKELIGHNIIGFDIALLHKLFPKFTNWKTVKVFDTIIGSKLIMGSIVEADSGRAKAGKLPPKLIGNHGLGAWGYRLGEYKGEYGAKIKGESEDDYVERVWSKGCKEMYDYCEQDVLVNVKLYNYLQGQIIKRGTPQRAIDIEHKFATIISRQERHGVLFNYNEAIRLEEEMRLESVKAMDVLLQSYKPKWFTKTIPKPQIEWVTIDYDYAKEYIVPKCTREVVAGVTMFYNTNGAVYRVHEGNLQHKAKLNKANRKAKILSPTSGLEITTTNAIAGSCSSPIELLEFSPTSGRHIIRWLKDMFDWQPSEFTDKGNPKTDADTLGTLTFEGIEELQRYQLVSKRLSQLSDAKGSLLKKYNKEDGRIYGRCDTLGAVTRRCTHCVPMSTKALTKTGWKHYKDLVVGEEILGFNKDKGIKEWTKILKLNKYEDAEVGSIGNKSQKLYSTSEHKYLVANRSTAGKYVNELNDFTKFNLVEAKDINTHSAILVNAPYANTNLDSEFDLGLNKYNYNHLEDILKFSKGQLDSYLLGFLLADGHLKKSANGEKTSWTFSQVKGNIQEATQTALYLRSSKRISAGYKNKKKKDTHQDAYNITQTQNSFITSSPKYFKQWSHETTEDVWCPTTELGTWVMKQSDNFITITGNSSPNLAQIPAGKQDKEGFVLGIDGNGWGNEFRDLFIVPKDYLMIGADGSGLELRTLAHYLALFDGGEYAKVVLEGDIHTKNQLDAGLPTRNQSKTFIYAFL